MDQGLLTRVLSITLPAVFLLAPPVTAGEVSATPPAAAGFGSPAPGPTPTREDFSRLLADLLIQDWNTVLDSLTDPEMVTELAQVEFTDKDMLNLYGEFLQTIVEPPKPGDDEVYLIENGQEALEEVTDLLTIAQNLIVALSQDGAEPHKIERYGPLLSAMRMALLVDRVHIPLAIAGNNSRDVIWFESHREYTKEASRLYSILFPDPGVLVESYAHPATGLVFPDEIAALKRKRVKDYDDPGLGTSVGYNGPGITVTLYLYDMGLEAIPSDLDSPILKDHFAAAVGDIMISEKIGSYREVKQLSEGQVAWGSDESSPSSLHAGFSYLQEERERLSHLYLRAFKDHFLKVRFTYDRSEREAAEKIMEAFLAALGRMSERPAAKD